MKKKSIGLGLAKVIAVLAMVGCAADVDGTGERELPPQSPEALAVCEAPPSGSCDDERRKDGSTARYCVEYTFAAPEQIQAERERCETTFNGTWSTGPCSMKGVVKGCDMGCAMREKKTIWYREGYPTPSHYEACTLDPRP